MIANRKTIRKAKTIPPPPGPEDGYDAIIGYFEKYSTEELEKAGHLQDVPAEEYEEMAASATYQILCREGLHLTLTRKDYEKLSRLAAKKNQAVEALVKGWIKKELEGECRPKVHAKNEPQR